MEALQHFLIQYSGSASYLVFFFLITVSSLSLCNSDLAFITAGTLSATGFFDYRILIFLGFFALLAGDSIVFFSGRKWGRTLVRKKPLSLVLNDEKMDAAETFFKKKGVILLFFVRFIPFTRTAIFLTTGSLQVKAKYFYLFNAFSTAIYLPLIIIGSNRAGANATEIISTIKKFQFIPIIILISLALYLYIKKFRLKKEGAL